MIDISRRLKWQRDYHRLRILGAPPVSSEGEGSPIINLAYFQKKTNDTTKITYKKNLDYDRHFKRKTTFTSEYWARRLHFKETKMTDIETISICDVDYTDRPSEHEDVEVENT